MSISKIDTPQGELFTAIVRDISAQEAVQTQFRLLETSISHLNDVLVITQAEPIDEPGPRIIFVNAACERHTGYSREEVMGKSPCMLQGPLTQRSELDRITVSLKKLATDPVRADHLHQERQSFLVRNGHRANGERPVLVHALGISAARHQRTQAG